MLSIHFANRLETLSSHLVDVLRERALSREDLWQGTTVVVPSAGMQRRLTLDLAEGLGICTNVHFTYLARWLWTLMAQHLPGVAASSPLDAGPLSWRILAAFQDDAWVQAYPRLAGYLRAADDTMRLELAEQVARLLDAYATFRPQWGARWLHAESVLTDLHASKSATPMAEATRQDLLADEAWQAGLWRRLSAELQLGEHHPAQAYAQWLDQQAREGLRPAGLPHRIHVVALPSIPPLHLHILQALGHWMEVEIYAINPCQEFWFDVVDARRLAWLSARSNPNARHVEVGHPLLAGWGQQTQAQLSLLVQACGDQVLDDAHFVDPVDDEPSPSLLAQVQSSILRLEPPAQAGWQWAPDDRSLEVHVCHSLVRELEVLHDRLLDVLSSPHPPALGDIVVVFPDLAAAAPWVDAVFGSAPKDRHIPYTVTGLGRSTLNPYAQVLLEVLAYVPSRWPVSGLFGLAQRAPVARHFGWSAEDLDHIRGWLEEAGVHWGLDGAQRQHLGLPGDHRHTVLEGLERLFLSLALPQGASTGLSDAGPWPAGQVDGGDAKTLGAMWAFVQALSAARDALAQPQLAHEWPRLLKETVARFASSHRDDVEAWQELHQAIDALDRELQAASFAGPDVLPRDPLPLSVVRHRLQHLLDDPARGGVPQGTVTFTSMSSLRHLPFKVICVLGLNDGAFPTTTPPPEFDLMARSHQPGDRQRPRDERNVFLDLLLSARQTLHLSYTGRHVRDNALLPPSVLVSELLEVLVPALAPAGDDASRKRILQQLVVHHPLQAFSESAFFDPHANDPPVDPRLQSFRAEYAQALQSRQAERVRLAQLGGSSNAVLPSGSKAEDGVLAAIEDAADVAIDDAADDAIEGADSSAFTALTPFVPTPLAPAEPPWQTVTVDQLGAFFRHPARYFLERRLGIGLPRTQADLPDDEPFVASRRLPERWAQTIEDSLDGRFQRDWRARALADPGSPSGPMGELAFERERPGLQRYAQTLAEIQRLPTLPPQDAFWSGDIDGAPWQLSAHWDDLRASGLVRWRYAEFGVADYLEAWWHHLLLCGSAPDGVERRTRWIGRDHGFELRPCESPQTLLRQAMECYARGLREPLPFFPKSAWAYAQHGFKRSEAKKAWEPSRYHRYTESTDSAILLAWRGRGDPLATQWDAFDDLARQLLSPLLDHLHELHGADVEALSAGAWA